MAQVDVTAERQLPTIAIVLRAARLGLVTAAEGGLVIDRVAPHTTTFPPLSIKDNNPAGGARQTGSFPINPDRTV